MISFVWAEPLPLYSGRGGSETYTIGHARELLERGIPTRIITVGLGKQDGRIFFPDIPFFDVNKLSDLSRLDETLVFVNQPPLVKTKRHSYLIMHCQPPSEPKQRDIYRRATADKTIITNSKFMARLWAEYLGISRKELHVVYPFADPVFDTVPRVNRSYVKTPILYAGRLTPEKGIYVILEALHHKILRTKVKLSITTAGNQTPDGRAIERFLRGHSWVKVVRATNTPAETAKLFSQYQVVVMPSNPYYWAEPFGYWREPFGMISVEAQHAGCYVVASNDAGLPETDCGGLVLFQPGNSYALALAVEKALHAAPLTHAQRQQASKHFTRTESVNALLAIIK